MIRKRFLTAALAILTLATASACGVASAAPDYATCDYLGDWGAAELTGDADWSEEGVTTWYEVVSTVETESPGLFSGVRVCAVEMRANTEIVIFDESTTRTFTNTFYLCADANRMVFVGGLIGPEGCKDRL